MLDTLLDIRIRTLRDARGRTLLLEDVSLQLHAGEIVGVAGHVGAGKSTLGLLAAGLLHPGRVLEGEVRRPGSEADERPGYVFANPWTQLTGWGGTVREEVAVGPENLGIPHPRLPALVDRALEITRTDHLARRDPLELSGGELQRVALASALALGSRLLVLDEPASQLDPRGVVELAHVLRDLANEGHGILLIEQHLELLGAVCDRVLVLNRGRVLRSGGPALLEQWPPIDPMLGAPAEVIERHLPLPAHAAGLPPGDPLLSVTSLRVGYEGGADVLHHLSLALPHNQVAAWVGENGVGKTTLARSVMGLVPVRSGTICVAGESLNGMPVEVRARLVGLVFQEPSRQLFASKVLDEVVFAPMALGWGRERAREAAREALAIVGLEGAEETHPGDLTPQARRLLSIACAMAARPPLLLLDEPTAGQDAGGRTVIARALAAQRRRGSAAVITHDIGFARRTADLVHRFDASGAHPAAPGALPLPNVPNLHSDASIHG